MYTVFFELLYCGETYYKSPSLTLCIKKYNEIDHNKKDYMIVVKEYKKNKLLQTKLVRI